ncbi:enoyl-CoA delta isomerase 2 [Drosophila sulfurigaster albostrigata]|uniref:enoyl-CoA delta isomerase 2 n=1 Tax=Drosophila sulfurigaster albostrigata TaxID=89887 RepID=UPI002D21C351|nr:enoyl-CoA delta isomerase 2 [Drosophila sulfurigaster albostrigata]
MSYLDYKALIVQKEGKVLVIKFYNPAKKNCLNRDGYGELTRALTEVNDDNEVTIVVITGVGEYFTAGNELTPIHKINDVEAYIKESNDNFKKMVTSFINCNKLIFTLVNGPSIGIGTTIVALSDVAWCAEEATFLTPFSRLGLVPEACSSFTFPLIMGRSKATEVLVLNEKLSAQEAYHFHFVSRIFKLSELDSVVWPKIREYSELPPTSMRECKRLINFSLRESLKRANDEECEALYKRFFEDEFIEAIMKFNTRKSKL